MLMLTRHSSPVRHVNGTVDRAFAELLDDLPRPGLRPNQMPHLDLWTEQDEVRIEVDLPGYSLDDVEVLAHSDRLILRGKRRIDPTARPSESGAQSEEVRWYRRERGLGAFERSVSLPFEVDTEQVKAALKDGVLRVALPKAKHAMPRRIEIRD